MAWLSVWSEVQTCIMAQLIPLPLTVSCFIKIQIGFTFLVPAHLGVCVCLSLKCTRNAYHGDDVTQHVETVIMQQQLHSPDSSGRVGRHRPHVCVCVTA